MGSAQHSCLAHWKGSVSVNADENVGLIWLCGLGGVSCTANALLYVEAGAKEKGPQVTHPATLAPPCCELQVSSDPGAL